VPLSMLSIALPVAVTAARRQVAATNVTVT
jgi:hypothetical protein